MTPASFTCPRCKHMSFNANDVREGYCGFCHTWTRGQSLADGRAYVFGDWDAPATDDAERIPVPTDLSCIMCQRAFEEGDAGMISATGLTQHRECGFRSVMGGIGHHVDHERYCKGELGTDAGLDKRTSAMLVWGLLIDDKQVTPEWLDILRRLQTTEDGSDST